MKIFFGLNQFEVNLLFWQWLKSEPFLQSTLCNRVPNQRDGIFCNPNTLKLAYDFAHKSYLGYSDDIECSLIFGCGATTPFILSMADFSESSLAPCWTSLLTGDDTVSPGAALSINWSDATEY